jgi:hypothetical protein
MQPIRDRASSSRSITMAATASPAIKLRVSLASTKATLPSKRPMAIDAKPSAHVMWKRLAAIGSAAKQMPISATESSRRTENKAGSSMP